MTYQPLPHIGIILTGKLVNDRDVAFACEAVRRQLQDHAAPAWGMPPPGVFVYSLDAFVPAKEGAIVVVADSDGNPDTAGYHSVLGDVPWGIVDSSQSESFSRVLSHECLEIWANAYLDRWAPGPDGLRYAMELCDPVQEDGYEVDAELFGERRTVEVSDFVVPAWFGIGDGYERGESTDYAKKLYGMWELDKGGYAIAQRDGRTVYLAHQAGAFMGAGKLRRHARTARLLAGSR